MAAHVDVSTLRILPLQFLLIFSGILSFTDGCYYYTSIISFGDSLADTGNLLRISPSSRFASPPYGESYFHVPTGRCSDGRLVIDFIAQHLGLPLVPPCFGTNVQNFKGVNFAVVGATALDFSFLQKRGIHNPFTNSSLNVQLGLFKQLLPSICSTSSECKNELLGKSLFLMGEIGGNDYNYAFEGGMSDECRYEVIELGAVTILVPGNFPIGCLPAFLTRFETSRKQDYDPATGCLIWLNEFAEYHNEQLRIELTQLQQHYPHTRIIYADYYNAAMQIFRSPRKFGFTGGVVKACCGGGGTYNYNSSAPCGSPDGTSLCDDPSLYINWDGIHGTEAFYRLIAKAILFGPYSIPQFNASCIGNGQYFPLLAQAS